MQHKSSFRFMLRATNGQKSPQFRYKNAHVTLTCLPDESGLHSFRSIGTFQRFLRLIGANFSSLRHRTRNLNKLLCSDNSNRDFCFQQKQLPGGVTFSTILGTWPSFRRNSIFVACQADPPFPVPSERYLEPLDAVPMERETGTLICYKDIVPMGRRDNLNAIRQYPTLWMEYNSLCLSHTVIFEYKLVFAMVILLKKAYDQLRIHVK
jgi:hypothetical protein